jgi:hypothetical protein
MVSLNAGEWQAGVGQNRAALQRTVLYVIIRTGRDCVGRRDKTRGDDGVAVLCWPALLLLGWIREQKLSLPACMGMAGEPPKARTASMRALRKASANSRMVCIPLVP